MISPQARDARLDEFKRAPRHVKASAGFAALLGVVILIRFFATAYAGRMSFGRATWFGLLVLAVFVSLGSSLYGRKRFAYITLAVFAALPLLNLLATSVHLLRLARERAVTWNNPETLVSVVAVCQFVVTCVLFRHLLASETRNYVWKTPPGASLSPENLTGEP
jgi:type II secretory pathway component PulF